MRQTGLSLSEIENSQDMNAFIDKYQDMFNACQWAKMINPLAKKCTDDCPFPICPVEEIEHKNQTTMPRYVESFKRGLYV